jgi:hypothetical protein
VKYEGSKPICHNSNGKSNGGESKEMSNEEESVVKNNINEVEKILSASGQYVTIQPGGKTVLQFLPQKGMPEVEKIYNGQQVKKIRFIVIDPNSGSNSEKFFDVGKRSARLIVPKIKGGHRTLKIERIGSGKDDTLYLPTEVSNIG